MSDKYDYEIQSGIPIPKDANKAKYPFTAMKVGDSFYVECGKDKEKIAKAVARIRHSAQAWRYANGGTVSFLCRATDMGVRCWRVEDKAPKKKRGRPRKAANSGEPGAQP